MRAAPALAVLVLLVACSPAPPGTDGGDAADGAPAETGGDGALEAGADAVDVVDAADARDAADVLDAADVRDGGRECVPACFAGEVCGPDGFCRRPDAGTEAGDAADGVDVADADAGCTVPLYVDGDRDGYGSSPRAPLPCGATVPEFASLRSGDCDDANPAVNPGAVEICDGLDQNCDGNPDLDPDDTRIGNQHAWCRSVAAMRGYGAATFEYRPRCVYPSHAFASYPRVTRVVCMACPGPRDPMVPCQCWDERGTVTCPLAP